jgi:pimeloyl-ACP methyl ester carboxylesterase
MFDNLKKKLHEARERLDAGSMREAIAVVMGDSESDAPDMAPRPTHGKCDSHPGKRKSPGFIKGISDVLFVPPAFALLWRKLLLEPDYVLPGAEKGPVLKHPREYGLPEFSETPISFFKNNKGTGEKKLSRQLLAWSVAAQPGFPTIAYCHGNTGSIDARRPVLRALADAGFGVTIVAYPGFKGSKDYPKGSDEELNGKKQEPTQRGFINAAKGMYSVLRRDIDERKKQDPRTNTHIIMFGESLGGAVATQATREIELGDRYHDVPKQDVGALVCFAAFRSLPTRVREEYPLMPASMLMGDLHLDTESVIDRVKAPIVLIHGDKDEVTCKHHSEALLRKLRSAGKTAELIIIPGGNHRLSKKTTRNVSQAADIHGHQEFETDPEQVQRLVYDMQAFLHKKGLCPPPKGRPSPGDAPGDGDSGGKTDHAANITGEKDGRNKGDGQRQP